MKLPAPASYEHEEEQCARELAAAGLDGVALQKVLLRYRHSVLHPAYPGRGHVRDRARALAEADRLASLYP